MPALAPAFAEPALASQALFRAVMAATARPGTIQPLASVVGSAPPLSAAAAGVALTLLDYETPVWLDPPLAQNCEIGQWFKFHTGAPLTENPREASFAFVTEAALLPDFATFAPGSAEYPDRSTTLVVQVDHFGEGNTLELSGPGIVGTRTFSAAPLPADFRLRLIANRARFPLGVDLILVSDNAVAALPRSVRVKA